MIFNFVFSQASLAFSYVSLPMLHRIGTTSTFEYLIERRFDRRIRSLGSAIYILKSMLFVPVVVYIPALVFSQGKCIERIQFRKLKFI